MISNNSFAINKPKNFFASGSLLAANVAQEVFSAAVNTKGAFVYFSSMLSISSVGFHGMSLVAKASVPSGFLDGSVFALNEGYSFESANYVNKFTVKEPFFVPAGLGMYFISNVAEIGGIRCLAYTIL